MRFELSYSFFIKSTKEILFVRVISYIRLTLKHIEL